MDDASWLKVRVWCMHPMGIYATIPLPLCFDQAGANCLPILTIPLPIRGTSRNPLLGKKINNHRFH